jgi:glycosyltransferase involved in cell wall biosynthesis
MKKKLLYIVNVDKFFISHRIEVAKKACNFFSVHLATKFTINKNYFKKLRIKTHDIKIKRRDYSIIYNLLTFFQILWIIIKIKPDLIHFVSIKPVLFGGIIARFFLNTIKVFSITGLGYVFIQNGFFSKIRKFFFIFLYKIALNHKNCKIIFQNLDDYNIIKKAIISKKNIELIKGSGVCLKKYSPRPLNFSNPVVMLPSRMLSHKGLYEFVEAAKILMKKNINARFVLVGDLDLDNPAGVKIEEINNWVNKNLVEYWGYKKNMNRIINLATIVVLPSYREGFPKILMEAASCGRPVVTTNVPGCRDAITKDTGILVPAKNSRYLANAIINLLKNKKKIKKMSKLSRQHAINNFDINKIVDIHVNIYKKLI